jgi:hypothetical protein
MGTQQWPELLLLGPFAFGPLRVFQTEFAQIGRIEGILAGDFRPPVPDEGDVVRQHSAGTDQESESRS